MTAHVIDGHAIASKLKQEVINGLASVENSGSVPGLATISVGANYSAKAYERRIRRVAGECGVECQQVTLGVETSEAELLSVVADLNADNSVHGIVILRPLPSHIDEAKIFTALSPIKDIEAVHPENAGRLALGNPRYVPSTAAAAFHVLDEWLVAQGEDVSTFYRKSSIVVVGRSNNVGKPAISLGLVRQASVESIDEWASKSGQLGWHTRRADILISAAGVPDLIRAEHVKEGAIVLDIGINPKLDPDTGIVRMVGDVDFDGVSMRARAVTPVPGGIGPVTEIWLIKNTIIAASLARESVNSSIGKS